MPENDKRGEGPALTEREREALKRAAEGMTNREIADALQISSREVEQRLLGAYKKLGMDPGDEPPLQPA